MIKITKINNVFVRITAEEHVYREIADYFSYKIPHYVPKQYYSFYAKKGFKKSLFNRLENTFYIGLLPELISWIVKKDYEYEIDTKFNSQSFSEKEALEFISALSIPFEVRDYQLKYFIKAIRNQRMICHSPTSSGKSLIIYLIVKYFHKKTLIIVPTVNLVTQLKNDFISYGCPEEDIHMIFSGQEKKSKSKFLITTWQSVYNEKRNFFEPFEIIIGDEVHEFAANSLIKIMTKTDAPIRIGFTGSMPESELYEKQVTGLFGPTSKYTSTKDLMDQGHVSSLLIKAVVLHHVSDSMWESKFAPDYEIERDNLLLNKKRNIFLANLALSQKGNTFVMFDRIAHGKELYNLIKEKATCPVYFSSGEVSHNDRDDIINKIRNSSESITVCSRVFVRGISINSLNNIIFCHPSKSRTKILQSIGRALRKNEGKSHALLIDVVDNLIKSEKVMNTTFRHFLQRMKIYNEEKFTVKRYDVDLK